MKKIILSICTSLVFCVLHAQCPSGDVILTTQQEVNDFVANYPNCTSINGSLEIGESNYGSYITDISGLSQITSVTGWLEVHSNYLLTSLSGLNQLTSVVDGVFIGYNNLLTNLNGLNQLTSMGQNLTIRDNPLLTSLDGLDQLISIGGYLDISENNSLTNLSGFDQVTSVGRVFIRDNDGISNLDGLLPQITSVLSLDIRNNESLSSLNGLSHITSIVLHLLIDDNDLLTTLDGLNQLTSVGGDLEIRDNGSLANLDNLTQLTSVGENIGGNLVIASNSALIDLGGLSQLTSVRRDLEISNNDLLISLNGLNNLIDINGTVSIGNHAILNDITALENVDTMLNLSIFNNPNLSFCSITSICNHIENGGNTVINSNNAEGCNSHTQVLENCTLLSVEVVNPLQIRLKNHTALLTWRTATETNNSGFEVQRSHDGINWERIGWQAGQGTTNTPHAYTHIDENPLTGISYYRLKQVDFDGQFSYSNIVSLRNIRSEISIYPNPVKDRLHINTSGNIIDNILIFNTMGQQINAQFNDNTIDVSLLSSGLYTIKITINEEDFYEKIVVE